MQLYKRIRTCLYPLCIDLTQFVESLQTRWLSSLHVHSKHLVVTMTRVRVIQVIKTVVHVELEELMFTVSMYVSEKSKRRPVV